MTEDGAMKLLLATSVLVNVLLGALLWSRSSACSPGDAEVPVVLPISAAADSERIPPPVRVLTRPEASPLPWSYLETDDVDEFLARLRATGCPAATQRDLVTLRLARQQRERRLEIQREMARLVPWWRLDSRRSRTEEQRALSHARRALRDEVDAELERLFGEPGEWVRGRVHGRPPGPSSVYLSPDEHVVLARIDREFRERGAKLSDRFVEPLSFRNPLLAEHREQERVEREAAVAAALSPEAHEEYQMRHSSAARYVLNHLPPAASEAEFRQKVRLALELGMTPPPFTSVDRYGLGVPPPRIGPELEAWRAKEAAFQQRLEALRSPAE